MNTNEFAQRRLYHQLVCHQPLNKVDEVVQWMGAIQAQDYRASLWAIGLRLSRSVSAVEATVKKATAERKIVRTWPMRGTLHWVAARDTRWMLRLLTPRVIKASAGRYRQLELDMSVFNKSSEIVEKALSGGKSLERPELFKLLEMAVIRTADQRGVHILAHLAMTGVICQGEQPGSQPSFVLLEDWLPYFEIPDQEECLATLASRYFKSHGPATVYDFSVWSGIKVSEAKKALDIIKAEVDKTVVGNSTYWFSKSAESMKATAGSEGMYLLPAFDEILCGYKDKTAFLDSEVKKSIILKNGIIRPIVIAGSKAIGCWKRTVNKNKVTLKIFPFDTLDDEHKKTLTKESGKFGRFLEKDVSLIF